jgi:hypothetical protein
MWIWLDKLEQKRLQVCLLVFSISIVPASAALSFASFTENDLFVALILLFASLTLSMGISLAAVKMILLFGVLTLLVSLSAIIYGFAAHPDLLKPYLKFIF